MICRTPVQLERTEELLHKGLKEINDKGDYNNVSLDIIGKTVDAIKDIHMIMDGHNKSYGGHHGGEWTAEGTYGRMFGDGHGDGRYYEGYRRMYGEDMGKPRRDSERY